MSNTIRELDRLIDAKMDAREARAKAAVFAPPAPLITPEGKPSRMVETRVTFDTNKVPEEGTKLKNPFKPNPAKPNTTHGGYGLIDPTGLFYLPFVAPAMSYWVDAEGKTELVFQSPPPA